jgi:hypothetical protein
MMYEDRNFLERSEKLSYWFFFYWTVTIAAYLCVDCSSDDKEFAIDDSYVGTPLSSCDEGVIGADVMYRIALHIVPPVLFKKVRLD